MKKENNTIYINGRFLTQKITGVQRYAIEVVKQLDMIKSNYKFIILAPKKEIIQHLKLENIQILNVGKFKGQAWEQISLPLYVLKHNRKAKLLNMCNLAPLLYPGYIVIHDIAFKTHPEHLDKKFALWYRLVTRINIRRYKHIFTVSNFSKNEILENYKVSSDKITVTYNSAEHMKYIKPDESIIRKLKLEDKEFCFSLGSKSPHKNHKFIVECAKNNPNMSFVISGNDNNIFKNKENKEKFDNMIYAGYLDDKQLVALYKKCKAFIFPSLYEGFGIPPLEALEAGCKNVIVSNLDVLKEIYGGNAKYIKLENQEYESKNILKKVSENIEISEEKFENYKWEKTARIILEKLR